VLAVLLQQPGHPVSTERLLNCVWGGDAPQRARDNLYTTMSRLRAQLSRLGGNVSIDTLRSRGYVLRVDEQDVDLFRFRMRRRQARAISESGDDGQALDLLHEAIALYHGEPLADLSGDWVDRTRTYLEDQLFDARVERVEVQLRLAQHTDLVTEVSELIVERPENETLVGHLMKALYRSGRQPEALDAYREARRRHHDLYDAELGGELQDLHGRILRRDRTLLPAPRPPSAAVTPRGAFPGDIRSFTGREEEIGKLMEIVSSAQSGQAAYSTVIAIDGMPGVGKTVLSIHLAHLLADEYPDGQFHLDLYGFDADRPAVDAGAALDTLLQRLGVSAPRVPRSVEDRAGLWRAELVSRRVLVVLDNAAGHEQIRPLLSSAPGCLTLVTSRRRLVGLDDVRSLPLDVLPLADASRLLERAIGPGRFTAEDDLAEVARLCGRLPLAIQLVGNRMRHRPAWTAAAVAKRLTRRPLAEIRAGGRELTAAFEVSYRGLDLSTRRAFRRLGPHLGSEFTLHGAAAAIGRGVAEADHAIEELLDHHLLIEPTEGRYRFHSLLREYARELTENEDSEATALLAARLLDPFRRRLSSELLGPADPAPIEAEDEAREWMAAEYLGLLAIAGQADVPIHTAMLAHALAGYLETEGHWDKAEGLHESAVRAWRELADPLGEAHALFDLSLVYFRTGRYGEALRYAQNSFELYRSLADERGKADVLDHRGLIEWQQSRYRDALASSRQALDIRRSLGDRRGEAKVLDHIAIILEFVGRYREAADLRSSALAIHTEIDDRPGLQMSLNNQGDLMLRLGRVSAARGFYENAAAVVAEMSRQHEAIWRNNMARIHQHTGRNAEALDGFRYALSTYRQIGDRRNEIETLIEIGVTYNRMGKREEALIHYEQAYAASHAISELFEQTKALRRIGDVLLDEGRFTEALDHLQRAIDLADTIGEPYERARALEGVGWIYLRTRGRHQGRRLWKHALKFYDRAEMGSEAERVRALLASPPGDPGA